MQAFEDRYAIAPSGCWLWQGPTNNRGYGRHGNVYAHRLSYERAKGPIPSTYTIDHLCRVRHCVNPDHLEAVPHSVNISRSPRARKKVCIRGHALAGTNLYVDPKGFWKCRTCKSSYGPPSSRPVLRPERRAELLRRAAAGERASVLAIEFNRSPQQVRRLIKAHGRPA